MGETKGKRTTVIYLVQILSALFALYSGRHDAPACDRFEQALSIDDQQAVFHSNNFRMKLVVVLFAAACMFGFYFTHGTLKHTIIKTAFGAAASALIIWAVFDIALNEKRKGLTWNYISRSNKTDRWLIDHFGMKAVELKVIFCAGLLIAINVVNITF